MIVSLWLYDLHVTPAPKAVTALTAPPQVLQGIAPRTGSISSFFDLGWPFSRALAANAHQRPEGERNWKRAAHLLMLCSLIRHRIKCAFSFYIGGANDTGEWSILQVNTLFTILDMRMC
jgi:hypothetical protein